MSDVVSKVEMVFNSLGQGEYTMTTFDMTHIQNSLNDEKFTEDQKQDNYIYMMLLLNTSTSDFLTNKKDR